MSSLAKRIIRLLPTILGATLFLASGCKTIKSTPKRTCYEGPEIKGSERFKLTVSGLNKTPAGQQEEVRIQASEISRSYEVETWVKTWREVERKRYLAFIGVHRNYNFGSDVFVDPLAACFGAVMFPIALLLAPADGGNALKETTAGIVSILPFVSLVYKQEQLLETVDLDIEEKRTEPVPKVELVPEERIEGYPIDWVVERKESGRIGSGRVQWPETIKLDWCEWVLNNPEVSTFTLLLTSDYVELTGTTCATFMADLKDSVTRRWPDPKNRPKLNLTIESQLLDAEGQPMTTVKAGRSATLRIHAKNAFLGPTAYVLSTQITSPEEGALTWESPASIPHLPARSAKSVDIPLFLPINTTDGSGSLRVRMTDVLGRSSDELSVPLTFQHTDLPVLQVFMAVIQTDDQGHRKLDITLRNSGQGRAERVKIVLHELPGGLTAPTRETEIESIDSLSRATISFPVTISTDETEVPITIALSESLQCKPVKTRIKAAILD